MASVYICICGNEFSVGISTFRRVKRLAPDNAGESAHAQKALWDCGHWVLIEFNFSHWWKSFTSVDYWELWKSHPTMWYCYLFLLRGKVLLKQQECCNVIRRGVHLAGVVSADLLCIVLGMALPSSSGLASFLSAWSLMFSWEIAGIRTLRKVKLYSKPVCCSLKSQEAPIPCSLTCELEATVLHPERVQKKCHFLVNYLTFWRLSYHKTLSRNINMRFSYLLLLPACFWPRPQHFSHFSVT